MLTIFNTFFGNNILCKKPQKKWYHRTTMPQYHAKIPPYHSTNVPHEHDFNYINLQCIKAYMELNLKIET